MCRFGRRGDEAAFDALVERYAAKALAVARRLLENSAQAEDAVQETFLRVVRARRRYDPCRAFSTWFFTILRNICVDTLRFQARNLCAMREMAEITPHTPADQAAVEESPHLLASLPKGERDVLFLRVVHDLRFRQIAAALGISTEAAKKRAQRGLRRLRRMIPEDSRPRRRPTDVLDTE